jgi:hypothetical protein
MAYSPPPSPYVFTAKNAAIVKPNPYYDLSGYPNAPKYLINPSTKFLTQSELHRLNKQYAIFQKVYAYNSNAYYNQQPNPVYYSFISLEEYTQYRAAKTYVIAYNKQQYCDLSNNTCYDFPFP